MEPRVSIITLGVRNLGAAIAFYRDGLGWTTTYKDGEGIAFFDLVGTKLALYPIEGLADDITNVAAPPPMPFVGITLAHNVHQKADVATVLSEAEAAGGRIVKPAQDVFWGGHSGYFVDPEGYHWEVAYNPFSPLDDRGEITMG